MGVITYKCPNCGGGLTFNADIQKYRCEYCLSEFSQEELDEIEKKELEKAEKRAEIQENNVLTEDVPVETSGTQAVQTEEASENTGRKKQLPLSCTFAQAVVHRSSQMRLRLLLSVITATILLCWKKNCGGNLNRTTYSHFRSIRKSPGNIYPVGRTEKIRTGLFLFSPPDREHDRCIFPLLALQLQGKG